MDKDPQPRKVGQLARVNLDSKHTHTHESTLPTLHTASDWTFSLFGHGAICFVGTIVNCTPSDMCVFVFMAILAKLFLHNAMICISLLSCMHQPVQPRPHTWILEWAVIILINAPARIRTRDLWLWYHIELHAPTVQPKSLSWWGKVGNSLILQHSPAYSVKNKQAIGAKPFGNQRHQIFFSRTMQVISLS
jgi:hypothetical protein